MERRVKIIFALIAAMLFAITAGGFLIYTVFVANPALSPLDQLKRYIGRAEYEEAVRYFDAARSSETPNADAFMLIGASRIKLGQIEQAAKDFEQAQKLNPSSPEAAAWQAEVLRLQGKPEEAIAAATEIAARLPKLSTPHAVIGNAHYDLFERYAIECIKLLEEQPADSASESIRRIRQGKLSDVDLDGLVFGQNPETKKMFFEHFDNAKAELELAEKSLTEANTKKAFFKDDSIKATLAKIHIGKNKLGAADALADKISARGAMQVPAVLLKYDILIARGEKSKNEKEQKENYQKAARFLEEYLVKQPNALPVREALYAHYVRQNMQQQAVSQASGIISRFRHTEPRYVHGVMQLWKGDYNSALSDLMSLQEQMKNIPVYQYNLGLAHYGSGNSVSSPAQAMAAITKVVELRPQFIPAMLMLAKLRLRDGLHKEAGEICDKILDSPGRSADINTEAYVLLSESYRRLKRYEESFRWLNLAFELDDSGEQLSRILEIISGCSLSTEQKAVVPTQFCVKGLNLLKSGKHEKALESFRSAMTLDRQYIMAFVCMGKGYESMGKYDDAIRQYQEAIHLLDSLMRPQDLGLHAGLARLLMKTKNYTDAETQIRNVLKLEEHNAPVRLRLAALELVKRRFTPAVGEVELAIRSAGDSAEARFTLALIHSINAQRTLTEIKSDVTARRAGDRQFIPTEIDVEAERRVAWDNAVASYERAMELDPDLSLPYEMAAIYAGQREYLKLAATAERALKTATPAEKLKLIRAINAAQLGQGDFEKAIASARELLKLAAEQTNQREVERARTTLINSLFASRNFRDAREEIAKLSGNPADYRDAWYDMIDRLAATEQLIRHETKHLFLHELVAQEFALADVFADLGTMRLPFAEQAFKNILAHDSDNRLALMQLADIYALTNRFGMSEEMSRRILQRAPKSAMTLRNLALIEEMRNRADAGAETMRKAIELYRKSIEAAPDCWLPKLELAGLLEQIGSLDDARAFYGDIASLSISHINGFKNPADGGGDTLAGFKPLAADIQKRNPATPFEEAFIEITGIIKESLDKKTEPVENDKSPFRVATDPALLFYLAKVLDADGKPKMALDVIEVLLRDYPSFDEREDAIILRDRLKD